jgi:hypothetical protein
MFRQALAFIALAAVAGAHDVITTKITWSKEFSRLVYKRCAMCHGEKDAIPLMTYEQARPWATSIKEEVQGRTMPPWEAVKGFGEFKDDRGLTQEEMEYFSDWVVGGSPEGNPKFMPEAPKPEKWLDPVKPQGAVEVDAASGLTLPTEQKVVAVRPKDLTKGASVQIIAARPDGSFEPLLWIYNYNPTYARTYYYTKPLSLPAGTKIEMSPADAGKLALFALGAKPGPAKRVTGAR